MNKTAWIMLAIAAGSVCGAHATTFNVSSADDIQHATANAKPGDELVMSDGQWKDQEIHLKASGDEKNPITLRQDAWQGDPRR